MISIGQGTVGVNSARLGVLVIPPGPGAVAVSNPGTADLVISSLIPTGDFTVATIVED